MKKLFLILLSFLVVFFVFSGCAPVNTIPLSTIEADLLATGKIDDTMNKDNGKGLKRFYGLNVNDFEEVLIYTPKDYMDVTELLIIKVKDIGQLDMVEAAIDTRIANQTQNFSGYGPDQIALLENYEIKIWGNTLFYCVSPDASELKDTFKKSIKD